MLRYIIKRILQIIPILLIISFMVFWLMQMAGDPVAILMGDQATEEQIEAKREELGLNRPIIVQYAEYMSNIIFKGDFGKSITGRDILEHFSLRLPYSILLCGASLVFTAIVAIPLGIFAAIKKGSWFDASASVIAMFGVSAPLFWVGLLLMLLFGVKLGWLPTSGIAQGVLKGMVLPTIACTVNCLGALARMTRSSMLDNLGADFLRTARAKGVKEKNVVWKHALQNALLPIITTLGNQFNSLIGGAVSTEIVFAWPGIGSLVIEAVRTRDFTMVTGCVIMLTLIVSVGNLLVDLAYAAADPRIRAQYSRK